jgi:ribosome-associated toxin RatA of RatAB toxin-antitoxin module
VLAAVQLAGGASTLDGPDLEWIDRDALDARAVVSRTSRDDGAIAVETAALIDASVEAIWDVLTACEVAPEYVPNVVACEHVERLDDGRADVFVQTIKPMFFIPRFEYTFRLDYTPYERIEFERISGGPLDRLEGAWWFLAQPDGAVLLVHYLEVHPGVPIPRFMLRATMRRDLTKIMEAVRDRAEAGIGGGSAPR